MKRFLLFVIALLLSSAAAAQSPPDFVLSEAFLKDLAQQSAAVVSLPVVLTHHTNSVHSLGSDCEMHLAGKPTGEPLADPVSIVVEPPNLCKFTDSSGTSWGQLFDEKVIDRDCIATGYPRIFTEHAQSGGNGANPNHVLEIHPALSIKCGSDVIDFTQYLKFFPGMRAIKPSTADDCVRNREVRMRYDPSGHRYEFYEDKGRCGNFAIAEIGFVEPKWIQAINGGHTAIARVSLDGQSRTTLKLYTLAGTPADDWLASVKSNGLGTDRVYVHGLLTYDYFAFVKAMRSTTGEWLNPTTLTKVDHPLALVVFGFPDMAPWDEGD